MHELHKLHHCTARVPDQSLRQVASLSMSHQIVQSSCSSNVPAVRSRRQPGLPPPSEVVYYDTVCCSFFCLCEWDCEQQCSAQSPTRLFLRRLFLAARSSVGSFLRSPCLNGANSRLTRRCLAWKPALLNPELGFQCANGSVRS